MLTFLPYLLIFLGFGLAIWSKFLLIPVNNLPFSALVHDASNHASSIVGRLFNHEVEQYRMQYDVFWNLELPGIILIISALSMIMAFKMVLIELNRNHTHQKIDFILKGGILGLISVFIITFLINGSKFLLLSLLVLAIILVVLMAIPVLLFMFLRPEKNK